jgi:hypothetical protein
MESQKNLSNEEIILLGKEANNKLKSYFKLEHEMFKYMFEKLNIDDKKYIKELKLKQRELLN